MPEKDKTTPVTPIPTQAQPVAPPSNHVVPLEEAHKQHPVSNKRRAAAESRADRKPPTVIQDSKVARAIAMHTKIDRIERTLGRSKESLTNMVRKLSTDEMKLYQEGIKEK